MQLLIGVSVPLNAAREVTKMSFAGATDLSNTTCSRLIPVSCLDLLEVHRLSASLDIVPLSGAGQEGQWHELGDGSLLQPGRHFS